MIGHVYWTIYAVVIGLLLAGCLWILANSLWDAWIKYGNREGLLQVRPDPPALDTVVWYRGWECGWDDMAMRYSNEGWCAYLGGADLDAHTVTARTWADLLDEIDDHNMTEGN